MANGWSKAENLGMPSIPKPDEFYRRLRATEIFISLRRILAPRREDIYVSEFKNNQYQKSVALDHNGELRIL